MEIFCSKMQKLKKTLKKNFKEDLTYQGLPDCTRPTEQRGRVVHSLHSQLIFGPVMGSLQPSPALPEGCLVNEGKVLEVVKSGTDEISGKGPTEMLSTKVLWFFLTLLEFVKLLVVAPG